MVVPGDPDVFRPSPRDAHPTARPLAVGGRLMRYAHMWETLSPDPWVRRVVNEGYRLEFSSPPPRGGCFRTTPIPRSRDQRLALEKDISDLLGKDAI